MLAALPARGAEAQSAAVRIDLAAPKAAIPATWHGIFIEEISHAFDGGLYAELIQNRSFEEGVLPPGMTLVKQPDGTLKMEFETLPPGVPDEKWSMPWPWGNNCMWKPERELLACSLDLMEFNPDGTIKPVVPTQTGVGPLQKLVPQGKDLPRGKYATATSVKSGCSVLEFGAGIDSFQVFGE